MLQLTCHPPTHPPTPPTGLYYLAPQLGDVAAVLQRYMWLMDLADGINAPLDNLINSNLFPLPQVGFVCANGVCFVCMRGGGFVAGHGGVLVDGIDSV